MSTSKKPAGKSRIMTILIAIGILMLMVRVGRSIFRVINNSDQKTQIERIQKESFAQGEKMLIGSLGRTKWLKKVEHNGRLYAIEVVMKGMQEGVRITYYPNSDDTGYCQIEQEFVANIDQEAFEQTGEIMLQLKLAGELMPDVNYTAGAEGENDFIQAEGIKTTNLTLFRSQAEGGTKSIVDFTQVDYEYDFIAEVMQIVKKEYLPFSVSDARVLTKKLEAGQLELKQPCDLRIHKLNGVMKLITERGESLYVGKFNKEASENYIFTSKTWLGKEDCDCEIIGALSDVGYINEEGLETTGDLEIVFEKGKDRIAKIKIR